MDGSNQHPSREAEVVREALEWFSRPLANKYDKSKARPALAAFASLEEQLEAAREALLTVAKDAHGPGYPTEHSFNGGPVKMHRHTLMMVDAVLASNPATEPEAS